MSWQRCSDVSTCLQIILKLNFFINSNYGRIQGNKPVSIIIRATKISSFDCKIASQKEPSYNNQGIQLAVLETIEG